MNIGTLLISCKTPVYTYDVYVRRIGPLYKYRTTCEKVVRTATS